MESVQPPAGSQVSRVPAQRTPPDQLTPPPVTPAPERPRRRLRTVLTVVGGVLAVLCVAGVVAGIVLYNRAATPDRSAPDVVVASYVQAYLVDRNDVRAGLFTCNSSNLSALRALRDDLVAREKRFSIPISVSWGSLRVQEQGKSADVQVELIISARVDGVTQSERQAWRFVTRLDQHWRVCEGIRTG